MNRPSFAFAALRLAALLAAVGAATAHAAPCAGFGDVDAADPFCPSIQWIRNRGVTLGCAAGLYCPSTVVTRKEMAAFLQRLGSALSPRVVDVQAVPGALDLDVPVRMCVTVDEAPVGYPRVAVVDGSVSVLSTALRDFALGYRWSTTAGATWNVPGPPAAQAGAGPGQWVTVPVLGSVPIDAGASVRFALEVASAAGVGVEASDTRCNLRVLLFSRDGATPPY